MLHPYGPHPSHRRETCRTCKGAGVVAADATGMVACPDCDGTGYGAPLPERPDALTLGALAGGLLILAPMWVGWLAVAVCS